jgi:hypothetical protein
MEPVLHRLRFRNVVEPDGVRWPRPAQLELVAGPLDLQAECRRPEPGGLLDVDRVDA